MTTNDRRPIEDYLPLDVLNAIASQEKKHPKRPVALVHYWSGRRSITVCLAAIYAALAPALRTNIERAEAASFVAKLAAYKPDSRTVFEACERLKKAQGGQTPQVLDMLPGGGAIPLETGAALRRVSAITGRVASAPRADRQLGANTPAPRSFRRSTLLALTLCAERARPR